jgi:pimeloyl-ACP methyl ester carboxylesterase
MKLSYQLLVWSLFSMRYLSAQLPSSTFSYQVPKLEVHQLRTEEKSGLRIHDLRFNGVANNEIPAYLVEPREGCGTKAQSCAGVLFVHWYEPKAANANRSEFLPEAYELARHGAVSLLVDTMWSEPDWFEKRNPDDDYNNSIAQVKNLRRALDVLTRHAGADRTRIGYVGHDFGMMFGAILAGIDHRVRPLALMAGTGCLSDWYLLGRTLTQEQRDQVKAKLSPLCPALYLPRATGPVLLQFGETDTYVPIKSAQALASAAPQPKRVRFYEAGHELNGQARVERLEWLQLRLRLRPGRER